MNLIEKYLGEGTAITGNDKTSPGHNVISFPNNLKQKVPSYKNVRKYDEVYIAGGYNKWGEIISKNKNTVKVDLKHTNVTVKYDQIVFWRYKKEYCYVNKDRVLV